MITVMSSDLSHLFRDHPAFGVEAGDRVFHSDMPVRDMFLVQTGEVHLVRHTRSGERLILHRAGPGAVLAEASAWSPHYHCDGEAATEATLVALPRARFLSTLEAEPGLAMVWAAFLARSVQAARLRSEIRSLSRVAARLDAWFETGNALPERGRLQDVAAELGVSREALYRELARRRKKGS